MMSLLSEFQNKNGGADKRKHEYSRDDYEKIQYLLAEVGQHGKATLAVRSFCQRFEIHQRNGWHWWAKAKRFLVTEIQPVAKNTALPILWDQIMDRILEIRSEIANANDVKGRRLWYNQLARFYEISARIAIAIDPETINLNVQGDIAEKKEITIAIEERIKKLDPDERRKYGHLLGIGGNGNGTPKSGS